MLSRKGKFSRQFLKRKRLWSNQDLPLTKTVQEQSDSVTDVSSGFVDDSTTDSSVRSYDEESNLSDFLGEKREQENDDWVKNMKNRIDRGETIVHNTPVLLNNIVKMLHDGDRSVLCEQLKLSPEFFSTVLEIMTLTADTVQEDNKFWSDLPMEPETTTSSVMSDSKVMDFENSEQQQQFDDPSSYKDFLPPRSSSPVISPLVKRHKVKSKSVSSVSKNDDEKGGTNVPLLCLNYLAMINSPTPQTSASQIRKFVLYHFPTLSLKWSVFSVRLTQSRKKCPWIATTSTVVPGREGTYELTGNPGNIVNNWKTINPTGMRDPDDYEKLFSGEVKYVFDTDGNIETEDNYPVHHGLNYKLADVMEDLMKFKNKKVSVTGIYCLIKEKYPVYSAQIQNIQAKISNNFKRCPWFKRTSKPSSRRNFLYSVDEERKGLPLLSRTDLPPLVREIVLKGVDLHIMDIPGAQSWYFYEVDKDGNEVTDETSPDTNMNIHARLVDTPGKFKLFLSWFGRVDPKTGEMNYKYNIGTSQQKYVTGGHGTNMINVKRAQNDDTLGAGEAPKRRSCTGPKKVADGGFDSDDDDDDFKKEYDDDEQKDKDDFDPYETEFWHALGLYSGFNNRIIWRVKMLLRSMILNIGVGGGYYQNFDDSVYTILSSLQLPRNPRFRRSRSAVVV